MLLSLPFCKLRPGGNPTVLLHDDSLFAAPAAHRAAIARAVLDDSHLGADQVGFLDDSRALPHLEMMGGELCINATLCAAVVFAMRGRLPLSREGRLPLLREGRLTASGAGEALLATVTEHIPDAAYGVALVLPLPGGAGTLVRDSGPGECLVRLPGITHLLLDTAFFPLPEDPVAAAAAEREAHGLDRLEAAGVIWHSPCADSLGADWSGTDRPGADRPGLRAIAPVVHVAATGSSVRETACGSGSLALALALWRREGEASHSIRQPSGSDIQVDILGETARVSAEVRITAQGTTHIFL
ncbi:MAG: hypothetical protein LBV01_06790 [Deltaproteobacteria bacterium]|jgi:hypothetical protein|nr:hypothetical protein [Deltaproteobacteria bacterium]